MINEITALVLPVREENGLVGRVERNTAAEITYGMDRKDSSYDPQRLSALYVSRYGIMGYVEYNITQEVISGILEVPKRLALLVHAVMGDEEYERWNKEVFGLKRDNLLDNHPEDLTLSALQGTTFLDQTYFWVPKPEARSLWGVMHDCIDDTLQEVLDTLKHADREIDLALGRAEPQP